MPFPVIAAGVLAASLAFVSVASAKLKHGVSPIAGWEPTKADITKLSDTVDAYFAALKEGRDEDAFKLRKAAGSGNDALQTFRKRKAELRATAGLLTSLDLGTAAWSKDAEVIVTVDFRGRLETAERYCGLLVLERTAGHDYRVAHDSEVVMTDAEAAEIAARGSKDDVAAAWTKRAALTCPSY